ncbi:MAG: uroporphyrinogen-III C-methyltransferase [Proteobacteria bacterium]|nr:uroporphyrinogen-III C-methyltransferase [Pseudomonadota bacterium]
MSAPEPTADPQAPPIAATATAATATAADPAPEPAAPIPPATPPAATTSRPAGASWTALIGVAALALIALLLGALLWQRLSAIQGHLARQSADSGAQALEAHSMAKQALDLSRETAARQALSDQRLAEVAAQRSQLDDLIQSLSRARDDSLVADLDASIRLAQQQSELTGSAAPLQAALKSADQRVIRASQPRLAPVQRAIEHDIDRVNSSRVIDTPGLLDKLDDLVSRVDDLPLANEVMRAGDVRRGAVQPAAPAPSWWQHGLAAVQAEARNLLRVSRIEQPEAMLLSPGQSFFLRENLKLKLLNARLGLLARQMPSARADLAAASAALSRYFDPASRKTQAMAALLQQVQAQTKSAQLPRADETLAALSAAAGK